MHRTDFVMLHDGRLAAVLVTDNPWRCSRCWGRVGWQATHDSFVCLDCRHVFAAAEYYGWKASCPRPTGRVVGPPSAWWNWPTRDPRYPFADL